MLLHDAVREIALNEKIDARFPYHDDAAAQALIVEGWDISLNAAFCVLHELCRPPRNLPVTVERSEVLMRRWLEGPDHPLKMPLFLCALEFLTNGAAPANNAFALMSFISEFAAQRAALSIAHLTADCSRDADDSALSELDRSIREKWDAHGI